MDKRPILFESACIFSLIGSSIGFLYMLISALFFNQMVRLVVKYSNYLSADHLTPIYYASLMGAYALSLAGAIKLYQMKRSGLYFYLTGQILLLILPFIQMGSSALSYSNILFTLVFSIIYLFYYRRLN